MTRREWIPLIVVVVLLVGFLLWTWAAPGNPEGQFERGALAAHV